MRRHLEGPRWWVVPPAGNDTVWLRDRPQAHLVLKCHHTRIFLGWLCGCHLKELQKGGTYTIQSRILQHGVGYLEGLAGRAIICDENRNQLKGDTHTGTGMYRMDTHVRGTKGADHGVDWLCLQEGGVPVDRRYHIDIGCQTQLNGVEWYSDNVCTMDVHFETEVDLAVGIGSAYPSRLPLEAMQ
jgi:hypothetical protein